MTTFQGREIKGKLRCQTFNDILLPDSSFVDEWVKSRVFPIDILSISTSWDGNNRYVTTVWYAEEK